MNKKLGSNAYDLYESDEINEVLLGLYNILNLAIDIEASHISIHPFQLVCMLKNGKERKYPPIILHNDLSYIEAFSLIMSRDLLAQKAFRIIAEENNKIEIKINYI